jgi:hypothetical protein
MKPEVAWQHEREAIDALLARLAADPELEQLINADPRQVIRGVTGPSVGARAPKPKPCGPLKTSCPPGKTCANKKSCVATAISQERDTGSETSRPIMA